MSPARTRRTRRTSACRVLPVIAQGFALCPRGCLRLAGPPRCFEVAGRPFGIRANVLFHSHKVGPIQFKRRTFYEIAGVRARLPPVFSKLLRVLTPGGPRRPILCGREVSAGNPLLPPRRFRLRVASAQHRSASRQHGHGTIAIVGEQMMPPICRCLQIFHAIAGANQR